MEKSSKAKEIGLKGKYVLYLMDIRMNITALIMIFNTKLWIKIRFYHWTLLLTLKSDFEKKTNYIINVKQRYDFI